MGAPACREFVEELREQWKKLWWERIDDKTRAEGIANRDFSMLFIDKGTIIFATRDFKQLSFREILQQHLVDDVERVLTPSPTVGGWGKFVRTMIINRKSHRRANEVRKQLEDEKQQQQLKKGGRGWLHF